jgi:3-oxoacyl-[acyl-carrier protein] reductase
MSLNAVAGRVVAVTGAARGLGAAMARRFTEEGALVAGCDLVDVDDSLCVDASRVDVIDSAQVTGWIGQVHERFGRLDVLVNNAGIIRDGRVETPTDADWPAVLDVSLGAPSTLPVPPYP